VIGRAGQLRGQIQLVVNEDFGRHSRDAGVAQEDGQRRLALAALVIGDSVVDDHLLDA
jgi:hypothetical protein